MTATRRTQQERRAQSSERLLSAAIELFAERGYERTTIAEIGRRAGYSHSIVSARYGTKDSLLETLLDKDYEPYVLQPADRHANGREQLLAYLDLAIVQLEQRPALLRAFFVLIFELAGPGGDLKPRVIDWFARYERAAVQACRKGQRDGSLEISESPTLTGRQFVGLAIGLAFRWTLDPEAVDYLEELRVWRKHIAATGSLF